MGDNDCLDTSDMDKATDDELRRQKRREKRENYRPQLRGVIRRPQPPEFDVSKIKTREELTVLLRDMLTKRFLRRTYSDSLANGMQYVVDGYVREFVNCQLLPHLWCVLIFNRDFEGNMIVELEWDLTEKPPERPIIRREM